MLSSFRRCCSIFVFRIETEYSFVDFLNCGPEISKTDASTTLVDSMKNSVESINVTENSRAKTTDVFHDITMLPIAV